MVILDQVLGNIRGLVQVEEGTVGDTWLFGKELENREVTMLRGDLNQMGNREDYNPERSEEEQ